MKGLGRRVKVGEKGEGLRVGKEEMFEGGKRGGLRVGKRRKG
jgi:hypothetical protein